MRRNGLVVFVSALLLSAMLGTGFIIPVTADTVSGYNGPLELEMTVENTTIEIGNWVNITFTLRNIGFETIDVWFGSSQSFDVYLCLMGFKIAAWSDGKVFLYFVWDISLEPGETCTAMLSWNFYLHDPSTGEQSIPPSPGNYSLVGLCGGHFLDSWPAVVTSELPITLVEETPVEISGDGIINIFDIVIVAEAFGSVHVNDTQDPRYCQYWHDPPCGGCPHDPRADINKDGIVDIFDLVIVALVYGSRLGDPDWDPIADIH